MAAAVAACFPVASLAAGVARVDFATGNVTAVAPDGRSRALSRGSEINVGETIATQQGRAQLRFADGAYMSLQPQTEFKVEEFRFSGKADPSDNIVMSLLKGGMRTITGLIGRANRNNYRLRTDVATIGIRGTEYSVRYTNSIEVFCADGSILVQNEGGTLQLNGGQGGYVASNQAQPQQTDNRPVLPPESPVDQQLQQQSDVNDPEQPVQEQEEEPPVVDLPALPPPSSILTGSLTTNVAVAHEAFIAEAGVAVPTTLDAAGTLLSFDALEFGSGITQHIGGTREALGNDGVMAWGRWVGGSASGDFTLDLTTEGAFHYVVGLPVTNMPFTGSATYTNTGHTPPTFNGSITSASFTSSTLNVDFSQQFVGINLQLQIDQQAYNASGSTSFNGSGLFFPTSLFESGTFCGSSTAVRGFLAGEAAARAGMTYHISTGLGQVAGGVVYERGAIGPSQVLQQEQVLQQGLR